MGPKTDGAKALAAFSALVILPAAAALLGLRVRFLLHRVIQLLKDEAKEAGLLCGGRCFSWWCVGGVLFVHDV